MLAGCGKQTSVKSKEVEKPRSTLTFLGDEKQETRLSELEKDLGFEVELDETINIENEFLAHNALKLLKGEAQRLRAQRPGIQKIKLSSNISTLIGRKDDKLVLRINIQNSCQEIWASILRHYEEIELQEIQQLRKAVENRPLVLRIQDLVGDDIQQAKLLLRRIEKAQMGIENEGVLIAITAFSMHPPLNPRFEASPSRVPTS